MKLTLHIWRQKRATEMGQIARYEMADVNPDMSFLEMLDVLNERLIAKGEDPVAFDHDCREGICGACGMVINGLPHGPRRATTACQLHMRSFSDGDEIWIEPWRAKAFPVVKDLVVDRSSFDRIIAAGGYISAATGTAPDGNAIPIPKPTADRAMVAAMDAEGFGACTNAGECEAVCPKEISLENIALMNRDYLKAILSERPAAGGGGP